MIAIAAVICVVVAALIAYRSSNRSGNARIYAAMCGVPLFLAFVAPLPFALASGTSARAVVKFLTWAGTGLSAGMLLVGLFLIWQAAKSGDRSAAVLIAVETAIAALPALIITAYALAFGAL